MAAIGIVILIIGFVILAVQEVTGELK